MAESRYFFNMAVSEDERRLAERIKERFRIPFTDIFRDGLDLWKKRLEKEDGNEKQ